MLETDQQTNQPTNWHTDKLTNMQAKPINKTDKPIDLLNRSRNYQPCKSTLANCRAARAGCGVHFPTHGGSDLALAGIRRERFQGSNLTLN